jgi:hypothetical protein
VYFQNRNNTQHGAGGLASCGTKMADQSDEPNGRAAVASYVATLSNDLATMARRSGLDTLGYLLEMVRLEAESVTRHTGPNGRRN